MNRAISPSGLSWIINKIIHTLEFLIIFIAKSLQTEIHSTNMLLWSLCRLQYAQSATANLTLVTFICRRICDKKCHLILWRTNRTQLISFFQPYSYSTVYDTTNEKVCQTIPTQECRETVKTEYRTVLDRQCVTEKEQQCSTVLEYVTENVCSQGNILIHCRRICLVW